MMSVYERGAMRGYKAFDENLSCRGYQYEVGKSYHHDGDIELCVSGFHYCRILADCFSHYAFSGHPRVCEIEASGSIIDDDDGKSVTSDIKIVRELSWQEVLSAANEGKDCSGYRNSGNWNSGNWNSSNCNSGDWNSGNWNSGNLNSGNLNSGNWNSGNRNSGNLNSGNLNSGDWNSGNRNSGNWNSGNLNSGNWNSGDWNITDYSSGVLCTDEPECLIFDKPSGMTLREWRNTKAAEIMSSINFDTTIWVDDSEMTDGEKKDNPQFSVAGGYLKTINSSYGFSEWWDSLTEAEKSIIKEIPNFDATKWKTITGIEV